VVGGPYTSGDGTVSFDGSASTDSDGDALTFQWTFGDGATSTVVKPSHTYDADGNYAVSLVVTDSKGLASSPAGTTAAVSRTVTFVGAGNIATCGTNNDEATAKLLDAIPGTVFTVGDNAFPNGTDSDYVNCYAPAWGRHKARTYATLGNHEYQNRGDQGNAQASFDYFGDRVGPRDLGYYSYNLGAWHIIVLNDKGSSGIDPASPQGRWLAADLAANTTRCTIAMWHVPLFLSSNIPGWTVNPDHKSIWDALYAAGVDIVINGQQHNYERFAPMNPDGAVDAGRGIREFNVGTGGESVDVFSVVHPNSEVRAATFGVLKLSLRADSYSWEFVPIAGATFSDSGSGSCH
jgi:PKD repeat protein